MNLLFEEDSLEENVDYLEKATPLEVEPEKPFSKIGSIVPIEEDHDLRTFSVLNTEGEIYKINTALPGAFYGPVWTRILSCYEKRQTLCGRLVKEVYGNSGHPSGYCVKIGKITTFLPNYHSLRREMQQGINIRVAILQVNPVSKRVIVSARAAYEILLSHKETPCEGEETDALFWDYDEKFVYLLLPGKIVGRAPYQEKEMEIASWMGNLTHCYVQNLEKDTHEALVTLSELEDSENFEIDSVA